MVEETVRPAGTQMAPRHATKPRVWHLFVLFLAAQAAIVFLSAVGIGFVAASRGQTELLGDALQQNGLLRELAESPEVMLFSILSGVVVCAGLAILVGALSPRPFARRLRSCRGRLSVAELAAASIGFLGLSSASDVILRLLPGYTHSGIASFNRFFQGRTGAGLWLAIALVGVAAPVGEEIFYRGALQTRFAERFGRRAGLAVTSVAFAVAHFEPIHMLFALAAGFYLGWLSDLAESCRASWAAHAVNNTIAAVGAAWIAGPESVLTSVLTVAVSVLAAAVSTIWLWLRTRHRLTRD